LHSSRLSAGLLGKGLIRVPSRLPRTVSPPCLARIHARLERIGFDESGGKRLSTGGNERQEDGNV
jgi:hypothetical protein